MAKGNLFLGMGRGSVGDVTFYRSEGEQISRARNRHPNNPRTARQAITRAVNSSVSRIYSAGQELFNHSFQGVRHGADTQRKFMQVNNRILRQLVLNDLQNGTSKARLGVPGVSVAVPCPGIMISDGNYPQALFAWDDGTLWWTIAAVRDGGEPLNEYAARVGLVPGDIYTFGALSLDNSGAAVPAWETASGAVDESVWPSMFTFQQLKVKDNVLTDTTQITSASLFSVLFDSYASVGEIDLLQQQLSANIALDTMTNLFSDDGCIFLIRSKFNEDLRSTSFLMPANAGDYGIKSNLVVAAWTNPTALQDPDVILDGSEFVD